MLTGPLFNFISSMRWAVIPKDCKWTSLHFLFDKLKKFYYIFCIKVFITTIVK